LRTNPSGIGSSNTFEALAESHPTEKLPVKNIAENTYSFASENLTDEVPQRVLPQVDEPVMALVTK